MKERTRIVRRPAVAGRFYPADPEELARSVRRLLDLAVHTRTAPRALIAPHAGYVCSGIVAAAAFRTLLALSPATYTVYLMGPAHWQPVHGAGLSSADTFATPLGDVPVAQERVQALLHLGEMYRLADDAHAPEHCLEVVLPFLQTALADAGADCAIVPMLFDEAADPTQVADDLAPLFAEDVHSLLVVSSDLSHYHSYAEAQAMDRALLDAVAAGDTHAAQRGQACGLQPMLALMAIAARLGWTPQVVDYRNSGDTCSLRKEVVGYGAVVYAA